MRRISAVMIEGLETLKKDIRTKKYHNLWWSYMNHRKIGDYSFGKNISKKKLVGIVTKCIDDCIADINHDKFLQKSRFMFCESANFRVQCLVMGNGSREYPYEHDAQVVITP